MKRLVALLIALLSVFVAGAQSGSENYVRSRKMLNSGGTSYVDGITYYDGIERPVQTLTKAVESGSVKKRTASLTEYDGAGRPVTQWLPVSVTTDYTAVSSLKTLAAGTNGYGDSRPYAQTIYEQSPLDRTVGSYGPGAAWAEHGVRTEYLSNTASGVQACKLYSATSTALKGGSSNYAAGTLQVLKTTDEDGHVSYTFTDRLGRTLLTRQMNGDTQHDTYYVYDTAGNLRYVLQPEYQTTADLNKYAFQYQYDTYNRCVRKTLPGAAYVGYEYDTKDRLVFSQDGNQRTKNRWVYYEYDNHGRLTEQGECTKSGTTATGKTVWVKNYYDEYDFFSEPGFAGGNYVAFEDHGEGHLTGRTLYTTEGDTIAELICYDTKGRESWVMRNNLLGEREIHITTHTYSGKPYFVGTILMGEVLDSTSLIVARNYIYDHSDRLRKVEYNLNTGWTTLAEYTYDDLDRLTGKKLHGSATNQLTYSYNIRDWVTKITGSKFTQDLYYNTGNGTACYNGNISSMTWKAGNESTTRGYKFAYDGLNRLTTATYGEGTGISGNTNRFTEEVTSYDKNGNIKALQRYGQTSASAYGLIDNLTYTLDGNRPTRVDDAVTASAYNNGFEFKDGVKQTNEYTYDANGNLTKDLNKGISEIEYNFLNLPDKVTFSDGSTIEYTYAADGTKLRTVHTIGGTTTTTDYCGDVIYENGVRKYLLTDEGYVTLSDKKYHYYLKDHQGNNRVVVDQSGTVEETNHYYPFGGVFASTASVQPYKYNGKELDTKKGLNWYDYGARHYDAALGRFTTQDAFAEKYPAMTPYQYGANNPVCNIDVNGDSIIVNPNPNGLGDHIRMLFGFDTKYQSQVKADLLQLKKDDKELKNMITHLEESGNIHTITMPNKRTEYMNGTFYDKEIARENRSQKSTILYDPFRAKVNKGNIRIPRVGLAHELHHSYNLDIGTFDPDIKVNGILLMDIEAVNLENRIRKITGDNKRTNYGNKKIPVELLE